MAIMTPGELAKDQFITVFAAAPKEIAIPDGVFGPAVKILTTEDTLYRGDVLKVKATRLPYIVVDRMRTLSVPDEFHRGVTLDTRTYQFMELDTEFVEAKLGKSNPIGF